MNIRSGLSVLILLAFGPAAPIAHADLHAVLHQIDTDSPSLAAANSRAEASAANLRVVRSRYFGSASLFGERVDYNSPRLIGPISPPIDLANIAVDDSQRGFGVAFSVPLDIDRRIAAAVGEQRQLSKAAVHDAQHIRLFLFNRAVLVYRGLQELQGNREALQAQHKALEKNYQVVKTKVDVGRVPRVELLRIDAERKAVIGQLAALDGQEIGLRAAIAALLGQQNYADEITVVNTAPREFNAHDATDILQRPDVKAAERRVAAAHEKLKASKRAWLPNMQLQANKSRNEGLSTRHEDTWSVLLRLNWELWDGGRRMAGIDNASAGLMALKSELSATRNQAQQELDTAVASWRAARLQCESAVVGLAAATETERIQSDRFQAGRISAADLIDAEAALAAALASKTSAMVRWWLADDSAHLAVGLVPTAYTEAGAGE